LTPVPEEEWPEKVADIKRIAVWRSNKYLVQLYEEEKLMLRLSICRTRVVGNRWDDGLTWDELQDIKRIVGFGNAWGLECYPASFDVVNVANMRHLWILPEGVDPGFGWRHGEKG
jgi:hypothetical protein